MILRLALAALCLACACAGAGPEGRHLAELAQETPETRLLREHAFTTWANAGVETPTDYQLALLPLAELQEACGTRPDHIARGCASQEERVILIDADASPEKRKRIIVHEVGHLAHGEHGHLQCDRTGTGPDVMCPRSTGLVLTARDIGFALSAHESP